MTHSRRPPRYPVGCDGTRCPSRGATIHSLYLEVGKCHRSETAGRWPVQRGWGVKWRTQEPDPSWGHISLENPSAPDFGQPDGSRAQQTSCPVTHVLAANEPLFALVGGILDPLAHSSLLALSTSALLRGKTTNIAFHFKENDFVY